MRDTEQNASRLAFERAEKAVRSVVASRGIDPLADLEAVGCALLATRRWLAVIGDSDVVVTNVEQCSAALWG